MSDGDLLRGALDGDREAFATLFHRYRGQVYRFARQMTGCPTTAEDVTQDVFVALLRHGHRFDASRGALGTYLYGITRRLVYRGLRSRRRHLSLEPEEASGEVEAALVASFDPLDDLERDRALTALRAAILALPIHYREVLVLCELEGLSYAEAAGVVGCRLGTVRSRLSRARALLVERLGDVPGLPADAAARTKRCLA